MKISKQVTDGKCRLTKFGAQPAFSRHPSLATRHVSGFTMVEIAICLAIIGIALVAIIGVLPIGINVQKDNRQETLVDQDAAVLLENIRNGARGMDGLTNYVFAITNFWTKYNPNGSVNGNPVNANGYSFANYSIAAGYPPAGSRLTNGANIIGLLTTPKYTDFNGVPISSLINGGISNHVVAWVHSISGPAVEKPPQNNDIIRSDSFSYKVLCNNAPVAADTPPLWKAQQYPAGACVTYINQNGQVTYWRATARTSGQIPGGRGSPWAQVFHLYSEELQANSHELRLTFLWPLLPNGSTGNGRHTFATTVAGQIVTNTVPDTSQLLYFFQPQSFTAVP